jgi:hypothetical protein
MTANVGRQTAPAGVVIVEARRIFVLLNTFLKPFKTKSGERHTEEGTS